MTVSQIVSQVALQQRLAHGNDRRRPRRKRLDQLGLGSRHRLDAPEQLEMHRANADDHPDVGLRHRRELGDLARPAHRHLEHEHLGAGGRAENLQRQPDLGVEVRARGDGPAVRRQ